MKNKALLVILAIIACVTLCACGAKEETVNNNPVNNNAVNNGNSGTSPGVGQDEIDINNIPEIDQIKEDVKDLELYSDNTKMVFKSSDDTSVVFYYSGNTITGQEAYVKYGSKEEAELAKTLYYSSDEYENDGVESVTVDGNYLIVKYKPSEYEEYTVEEIKATYELLNQIKNS